MEEILEKIDYSNLDEKLTHLSIDEVKNLILSYYKGVSIKSLLTKYKIDASVSTLVKLFPSVVLDQTCIKCDSEVVAPLESKSSSQYYFSHLGRCSKCGHYDSKNCECDSCLHERQERRNKKSLAIRQFCADKKLLEVMEENLSLEDRLYLATMLRVALSENTLHIMPILDSPVALAPTREFERKVISTLTGRNIIVPSVVSDIDSFVVEFSDDDENELTKVSFYIYKVFYELNIVPMDDDYNAMIQRLLYPQLNQVDNFEQFCFEKWKEVALHECIEYLLYQMNDVGYSFSPGEKTYRVFQELLEHFSVSQIYSIIYRSVANSTKRYQAREITKIHAQNSVISSCESYGQRAIAHNWNLTYYSRVKDLPETSISKTLYTSIMGIAELGFSESPTPHF